ncbi:retroviral-like aspartic protease family protein [Pseudoduganella violaceinigra]|uniref:retroviral-like aspartic protease family protein n=1 Tax=Pseudoduganella violaceinigra TaxID=246602 RepID=UPI000420D95B|nr:retroviral-like aspartic protease family protein [Pseudoduganella violaceinigra]
MLFTARTLTAAWLLAATSAFAATTYPPSAFKDGAIKCQQVRDFACAEKNWSQYLKMRPTDTHAMASLAIIYNWTDKPEASIVQAEKAIEMGQGTYDLFAAYAESLGKVGRIDEAIDWSYKTLAIMPSLVNVRGDLARWLVMKKREYEALGLLAAFDATLEEKGHGHYFDGQRIAIESTIERRGQTLVDAQKTLRLSKTGDHFYAPIKLGDTRAMAFVVDTGASKTTLSDALLAASKASYKVIQPKYIIELADGRRVAARLIALETVMVGPFELHKVSAIVCPTCAPLLGQATLSQFNMASAKKQGVEFLTLEPRSVR